MPKLSKLGQNMNRLTGVRAIMQDIRETLQSGNKKFIDLSAGNPVILPKVQQMWKEANEAVMKNESEYANIVGRYGSSQGYQPLIEAIVKDFNTRYGLSLSNRNILITPGSQSLCFIAVNLFAGHFENGYLKKVVLPLCPDYTGYGGINIYPESLVSFKPEMEIDKLNHSFKYHPNLEQVKIDESTGCILLSRPSNPTGNIVTSEEIDKLANLAMKYDIPLIIDSAYAPPYPGLNFTEMEPILGKNIIHCMSLSKAGLPGERIGIAIADEGIIKAMEAFLTNTAIHSSRLGQAMVAWAINTGRLEEVCQNEIKPYYQNHFEILKTACYKYLPDSIPWYLHRGEGGLFGWVWFENLPISDQDLYQKLKEDSVIVVPGSSFFPGLESEWKHSTECIRVSLTATQDEIIEGVSKIGKVIQGIYYS